MRAVLGLGAGLVAALLIGKAHAQSLSGGAGDYDFTASSTGLYTIEIAGGEGGQAGGWGGSGAIATATFDLQAGETLAIVVGSSGRGGYDAAYAFGGQGSFAYVVSSDTLLIAAGAGGAAGGSNGETGGNASIISQLLVEMSGSVPGVNGGDSGFYYAGGGGASYIDTSVIDGYYADASLALVAPAPGGVDGYVDITYDGQIPEPASLGMLGIGSILVGLQRRAARSLPATGSLRKAAQ